jgi:hypothetical protein
MDRTANLLPINNTEFRLIIQTTTQKIPLQFFKPISNTNWDREKGKEIGKKVG